MRSWSAGRFASWLSLPLLAVSLTSGCALYNRDFPAPKPAPSDNYDLEVVQLDDFGTFWNPRQANGVLEKVAQTAEQDNTFVLLFVHGWHHNAAEDDENLRHFQDTLAALYDQLANDSRARLRTQMTGSANFRLIGIYLGWRGRSLPGSLDYGTMWWRKAAAERAGDGDASEFIARLQNIYLRANSVRRPDQPTPTHPLMALVTMGHSFGGQVLIKSIARPLEEQLARQAPCLAEVAEPPPAHARSPQGRIVSAVGDLSILLNPATEAYQFGRIDALYRQLSYRPAQTPQLVIFSADNDVPRSAFFPIARFLTLPFRPGYRGDYQGQLFGQALGEIEQQQTHELVRQPGPDTLQDEAYAIDEGRAIEAHDFTDDTVFGDILLRRYPHGQPGIAFSPVAVVQAHDRIIDGHDGIFKAEFETFLAKYVSFIIGKRLILRGHQEQIIEDPAVPSAPRAPASSASTRCQYQE